MTFRSLSISFIQKIIAEIFGTYFHIFTGCGLVTVNLSKGGTITFPGIAIVWGLVVMVMVYSAGHISGAHFNLAITTAFATCHRFPWKQVPAYIASQVLGSALAIETLHLLFGADRELFAGTIPTGSNMQSLVLEFIITFYLMFVVSRVTTDNRADTQIGFHQNKLDPGCVKLEKVSELQYEYQLGMNGSTLVVVDLRELGPSQYVSSNCMDAIDCKKETGMELIFRPEESFNNSSDMHQSLPPIVETLISHNLLTQNILIL